MIETPIRANSISMEPIYYTRQFLNKDNHGSFAAIIGSVKFEKSYNDKGELRNLWPYTRLSITDCDRRISLDLEMSDAEYDNTLYKLDTLLKIIADTKRGIVKAKKEYDKLMKEIKANEEKYRKEKAAKSSNEA